MARFPTFAANLAVTEAWVRRNADRLEWVRPDAGALCCIRLRAGEDAAERFYNGLATHDIRVAQGAWFGDEARVFRLDFGLFSPADRQAALAGVSATLNKALLA